MARAVRFVKAEREWLKLMLTQWLEVGAWGGKAKKNAESVLAKLKDSEAPQATSRNHLTVGQAIEAFRSVLDRRLVVPPNDSGLVYIQMSHKLKALALTREQCVQAAEQAGREWKQGNIKAQSILNQAEKLLHNAESEPLPMEGRSDYETRFDVMDEL